MDMAPGVRPVEPAQDHRPVPAHLCREGGLVPLAEVSSPNTSARLSVRIGIASGETAIACGETAIANGVTAFGRIQRSSARSGPQWRRRRSQRSHELEGSLWKRTPAAGLHAILRRTGVGGQRGNNLHFHHACLALLKNAGMDRCRCQRRIESVSACSPHRAANLAGHGEGVLRAELVLIGHQGTGIGQRNQ